MTGYVVGGQVFYKTSDFFGVSPLFFFAQRGWLKDFCICAMAQYPRFYLVKTAGLKGENDFAVVQFFDFLEGVPFPLFDIASLPGGEADFDVHGVFECDTKCLLDAVFDIQISGWLKGLGM